MKITHIKYGLSVCLLLWGSTPIFAQESKGYKETLEMNADEKGDITVVSNIKYNAATWDYVKQQHGTDPSVLKNNIKRQFPKYVVTDFDIKNDDMERTSTIKFKIQGSIKVNENGKWMAELDSKNPDITKLSETQFLMVDEDNAQTSKINLPKSATDAKIDKDTFGKAVLTYNAPVSGGWLGNIIKYLGILLAAAGAFFFYKNRQLRTVVISDQSSKKIAGSRQDKYIDDAVVVKEPGRTIVVKPDERSAD
jgi:hypothetical protein